jgi:hypothetical protein
MNTAWFTPAVRICLIGALAFLLLQGAVLAFLGQPAVCLCGELKLWEGAVLSDGNSQQVTDWYTFSHVIHGFIFYLLTWLIFPRMSFARRFLIALALETTWEVFENTPMVINKYREQALAQGYVGDSILNSLSDTASMALGFVLARRFPVWLTVTLAALLELFVGYSIRDNLTLNILNFIHQFPAIAKWQSG